MKTLITPEDFAAEMVVRARRVAVFNAKHLIFDIGYNLVIEKSQLRTLLKRKRIDPSLLVRISDHFVVNGFTVNYSNPHVLVISVPPVLGDAGQTTSREYSPDKLNAQIDLMNELESILSLSHYPK